MMTSAIPIIAAKQRRTKVQCSPQLLPMFATICPFAIVGSEQCEGNVVLVLEGSGLPDAEWSTIMCSISGGKSIVEVVGLNG